MPELPEVEVVKRSLISKTQNLTVKEVKINDGRLRYKINRNKIKKIIGLKFTKISRRSKYLLFFFNKNIVMLVHLGMTGKFFFVNRNKTKYKTSFYYDINENKDNKHDRIIFDLSNNQKLIYNDIRKFGFIKFIKSNDIKKNVHLKYLGPEPLSAKFNIRYFKNYILGKQRNIKNILMDQKFISGLGNIYVNEILFFSGVRPEKKIKKLTEVEIQKIIKCCKRIISKAIYLGGSSIKDFSSSSGKKGEKCPKAKCKGKIKKIVIANLASFFCNKCQK